MIFIFCKLLSHKTTQRHQRKLVNTGRITPKAWSRMRYFLLSPERPRTWLNTVGISKASNEASGYSPSHTHTLSFSNCSTRIATIQSVGKVLASIKRPRFPAPCGTMRLHQNSTHFLGVEFWHRFCILRSSSQLWCQANLFFHPHTLSLSLSLTWRADDAGDDNAGRRAGNCHSPDVEKNRTFSPHHKSDASG